MELGGNMTLFEVLSLITGSGVIIIGIKLIFNTGKTAAKINQIFIDISEIKTEIKDVRKDIQCLDSRISRIEGQLMGPHYWEPKIRGGE